MKKEETYSSETFALISKSSGRHALTCNMFTLAAVRIWNLVENTLLAYYSSWANFVNVVGLRGSVIGQSVERLAKDWSVRGSNLCRGQLSPHPSRSALGRTQPPLRGAPGLFFRYGESGLGMALITHPHLAPRPRMRTCITLLLACHGITFTFICWGEERKFGADCRQDLFKALVHIFAWANNFATFS
jgi:hypothetical protein